jgi:hypothetical protein
MARARGSQARDPPKQSLGKAISHDGIRVSRVKPTRIWPSLSTLSNRSPLSGCIAYQHTFHDLDQLPNGPWTALTSTERTTRLTQTSWSVRSSLFGQPRYPPRSLQSGALAMVSSPFARGVRLSSGRTSSIIDGVRSVQLFDQNLCNKAPDEDDVDVGISDWLHTVSSSLCRPYPWHTLRRVSRYLYGYSTTRLSTGSMANQTYIRR